MSNFEIKKRLVTEGKSKVFENWHALVPSLTVDAFLEALEWVCEDKADDNGHLTREIGLTPNGIVKIRRIYDMGMTFFYVVSDDDNLLHLWAGAVFEVPCDDPRYTGKDGTVHQLCKISLSARDRI